jgi:hypothetical protein
MIRRIVALVVALLLSLLATPPAPLEVCCIPVSTPKLPAAALPSIQNEIVLRSRGGRSNVFQHYDNRELLAAGNKLGPLIYGSDGRADLATLCRVDPRVAANLEATALIVNEHLIRKESDGLWHLRTHDLRDDNVCSCERFSDQPTAIQLDQCTGFLLDSLHLVTASHCIPRSGELGDRRFVFGFHLASDGRAPDVFDDSQVRGGKEVVFRSAPCAEGNPDLVVVELQNAVRFRHVTLAARPARKHERLYVIGYPLGLPAKYEPGAFVRDDTPPAHFIANIDGHEGNSGSPVFDAERHDVVGVHVHGEVDLAKPCGCWTSTWCPDTGCKGEEATRIQELPRPDQLPPNPPLTNDCSEKPLPPARISDFKRELLRRHPDWMR